LLFDTYQSVAYTTPWMDGYSILSLRSMGTKADKLCHVVGTPPANNGKHNKD